MAHLYELTEQYRNISELLDDPTMDTDAISSALAVVEGDLQAKVQNCAVILQSLDLDVEMLKAEEQRLMAKRRIAEGRRDWLKGYIKAQMESIGAQKLKVGTFTLSIQKNPPRVEIYDDAEIPATYLTIIPEQFVADKKRIAADIKAGVEVPGAALIQGTSLRVR
jgi:hypothetical protein